MAKLMVCISEPSSNKYFDNPYKVGEKVIYLGEAKPKSDSPEDVRFAKQFIKIKRLKPLEERVESKRNFEFLVVRKNE
jgi:hypothetical protein